MDYKTGVDVYDILHSRCRFGNAYLKEVFCMYI